MAYTELSNLSDWHLVHPEQDIRGWTVQDNAGNIIGRVDELLVNTDSELVERIRLDNGDEIEARDIEIGDNVVHVRSADVLTHETTEPVVKTYRETRVRRAGEETTRADKETPRASEETPRPEAEMSTASVPLASATSGTPLTSFQDYDAYAAGFRSHYDTTYGSSGQGFNLYEPAYRYGYEAGISERYRGRDFNDLEPELRREYERENGKGTWDGIKDAVKYAFWRGREAPTS